WTPLPVGTVEALPSVVETSSPSIGAVGPIPIVGASQVPDSSNIGIRPSSTPGTVADPEPTVADRQPLPDTSPTPVSSENTMAAAQTWPCETARIAYSGTILESVVSLAPSDPLAQCIGQSSAVSHAVIGRFREDCWNAGGMFSDLYSADTVF